MSARPAAGDRTALAPRGPARGAAPEDRTQLKAGPEAARVRASARAHGVATLPDGVAEGVGLNPMLDAAGTLIAVMIRLRTLARLARPDDLRQLLVNELKRFEAGLDRRGYDRATALAARYALCSALDEAAMQAPWAAEVGWSDRSLLVTFHSETWGGEKVFAILGRLLSDPERHLDLLELIYILLRLGFEGRYQVQDRGRAKLDALTESLHGVIVRARGEPEPELAVGLSPPERPVRPIRRLASPVTALMAALACLVGGWLLTDGAVAVRVEAATSAFQDGLPAVGAAPR